MGDKKLVSGLLAGDEAAGHRFVADHYAAIHRFFAVLTRSKDAADELTQQTFVRARMSIATFRFECSLRSWLRKVAYGEFCRSIKEAQGSTVPLPAELVAEQRVSTDAIVLWDAIERLSPDLREAFVLREIDQLSVREVAHLLGVPAGTVKSRCFNAKQTLRRALETSWPHQILNSEVEIELPEKLSPCDP